MHTYIHTTCMYRLFRVSVCRVYVLALCNQHDKICCLFSGCSCSARIWNVHKKICLFFIVLCSVQAATWRKLFQQQKSFAKRVLERDLCCCCCCSCCFSSAASTLKSSIRPSPLLFALRPVHHTRALSRTLSLSRSRSLALSPLDLEWGNSRAQLFQLVYKCAAYLNLLLLLFVYFAFSAIGNWNWNFFSWVAALAAIASLSHSNQPDQRD